MLHLVIMTALQSLYVLGFVCDLEVEFIIFLLTNVW